MRAPGLVVVVCLLAVALAGCTDNAADSEDPPPAAGTSASLGGAGGEAGDDEAPEDPQTARFDLFFADDQSLQLAAPEAGSGIPLDGSLAALATGAESGLIVNTVEFDSASLLLADTIDVDLWLEADTPVVPNGVFDLGIYVGVDGGGLPFNAIQSVGGPIQPATPVNVQWSLAPAELWNVYLAPGDQVQALIVSGMVTEGSNLRIMTGGDFASKITISMTWPLDADAFAISGTLSETFTGVVPSGALGGAQADQSFVDHELVLPANTTFLDVRLSGTDAHHADLDLAVLVAGTTVGTSHTPAASEHVRIAGPPGVNLNGQTVTLRVTLFAGANAGFQLDVEYNE